MEPLLGSKVWGSQHSRHSNVELRFTLVPILVPYTEVFKGGIWAESEGVANEDLKELAQFLPTVVLSAKAPSTVKKYAGAFKRWKAWARQKQEVRVFPAKPLHVALYLAYLIKKSATSAPVEEAVNALAWVHQVGSVEDPTKHPLVGLVSRSQTLTGRVRVWSTAHIRSVLTPTAVGVGDKWVATTTFTLRH